MGIYPGAGLTPRYPLLTTPDTRVRSFMRLKIHSEQRLGPAPIENDTWRNRQLVVCDVGDLLG